MMNNSELRKFGIILGFLIALFLGLIIPYIKDYGIPKWPFIIMLVLILISILLPAAIKPIYIVWMKIGHILGKINTTILLAVIFYVLVTPLGFVMRIFGYNPLNMKNKEEKSYRKKSEILVSNRMEVPY